MNNKIFLLFWLVIATLTLHAQEQEDTDEAPATPVETKRWQLHFGIGMNIGVNGLPSQVANQLAVYEGYLSSVTQMRGLPLGASFFTGFGYRFANTDHSMGFEFGLGIHNDGGRARVTLGNDSDNIPGYVYDGFIGTAGEASALMSFIQDVYPGLGTINTMKGQYLDPKFRLYYRYNRPNWTIQTGLGLGFLIPFNYFAYPSKMHADYSFGVEGGEGLFNMGWKNQLNQGPITAARIPFPLVMRNGYVMMRAIQPLVDLHLRASFKNYYFDVSYSTEFRFINHIKLGMGILFQ
jgi:hypothetical protein